MLNLLFPGRHHLLTNFQKSEIDRITTGNLSDMLDVNGNILDLEALVDDGAIDANVGRVVWAVTSANHSNTRRNPLPAYRRVSAIEVFSASLASDVESHTYLIDDLKETGKFAEYVLKKIEVESGGKLHLTPENTIIGCSTPEVVPMYEKLGFQVLPFELEDKKTGIHKVKTPWELTQTIVEAGKHGWRTNEIFRTFWYIKYN